MASSVDVAAVITRRAIPREAPVKQSLLAVRVILFLVGLAAIGYLGLMLRDKWAREAEQQRQQPAIEAPADPAG